MQETDQGDSLSRTSGASCRAFCCCWAPVRSPAGHSRREFMHIENCSETLSKVFLHHTCPDCSSRTLDSSGTRIGARGGRHPWSRPASGPRKLPKHEMYAQRVRLIRTKCGPMVCSRGGASSTLLGGGEFNSLSSRTYTENFLSSSCMKDNSKEPEFSDSSGEQSPRIAPQL